MYIPTADLFAELRSWLPKIRDRDLFDAPKYSQATEALKACELDF